MVKYGITETGYVKKPYTAIISAFHDNAKHMFGDDVDLSPGSPIKIIIDLIAMEFVNFWNMQEACYNSAFLDTSTDYSLDNLGKLVGATRNPSTYATGNITFFRNAVMPDGAPRIIKEGTKVSTADILANSYVTTTDVYFQPTITEEAHTTLEDTFDIEADNVIGSLITVTDSNAITYTTSDLTFDSRTLTFLEQIDAGTTVYISYKPLSVTAPIQATKKGASSNVASNVITILDTSLDFIHYIANEDGIDTGSDVESDSHFRQSIIGATQAVGKATENALKYYIGKVTGVKNVIVENPLQTTTVSNVQGNGTTSVFVPHIPLYSVTSVVGSLTGSFEIDSFNSETGEIQLTVITNTNESIAITYTYVTPGNIKIYVEGGETGDEYTEDTIVYAIEHTRAAGIKAVGYDSGDSAADGSPTAKFSWFYRPNNALINLTIVVYFDSSSDLTSTQRDSLLTIIQSSIASYIDDLDLGEKIYKNKVLQLAISASDDIVDAELIAWQMNSTDVDLTSSYIQPGEFEVSVAQTITLTKSIG